MILIDHVTKTFDSKKPPLFSDLTLSIPKGKMIGLVGPDAAGKTTLIRLIAGLLTPTEGSVKIGGYDTMKDPEMVRSQIGYMPQLFGLYEDLSVMQNLNLYLELQDVPKENRAALIEHLLEFTRLTPFTDRLAGKLSGGMKQKLGLACALMKKPALLLLDEPTVGVDPLSRRELWEMVVPLVQEGVTVLWGTVYLTEAEKCDQIVLLNQGQLLFEGAPQELTQRVDGRVFKIKTADRRKTLAEVIESENMVDALIEADGVRVVAKTKEFSLPGTSPESITPQLEDAFIDILGGRPKGKSPFAHLIPTASLGDQETVIADHLTKRFDQFVAVNDISFRAKKGEIFGLLGPNGAGKSTTYKMLCGLLTPTHGKAIVGGYNLQEAPAEARMNIGYMAQKFSLYGNISVLQNLRFFGQAYKLPSKNLDQTISSLVHLFQLDPFLNTDAEQLPLGLKQRLSLICAVLHWPNILFLDEPTSGMDPVTRREFWSHIDALAEKGRTVLITTHFMLEAENCDRLAMIYKGNMIHLGTPEELKERAKTEKNPNPSLEDAFIQMIEEYDQTH